MPEAGEKDEEPLVLPPEVMRVTSSHDAIMGGVTQPHRASPRKMSKEIEQQVENYKQRMLDAKEDIDYMLAQKYKEMMEALQGKYARHKLERTLSKNQAETEDYEAYTQAAVNAFNDDWDDAEREAKENDEQFVRKLKEKHDEQMAALEYRQENTEYHPVYPVDHNWMRTQQIREANQWNFKRAYALKVELDKREEHLVREAKKRHEAKCQNQRHQLAEAQTLELKAQKGRIATRREVARKERDLQTAQLLRTLKASKQDMEHSQNIDVKVTKGILPSMESPRHSKTKGSRSAHKTAGTAGHHDTMYKTGVPEE